MIRSRLPLLKGLTGASVAMAAACGGGIPQQVLRGPAPVVPAAAAPVIAGPWFYRPSASRRGYSIEQRALLRVVQDTATLVDSVASRAELSFTAYAPTRRVSGVLSAFRAQGLGSKASSPRGVTLPAPFVATYAGAGGQLGFTTPDAAAPCGSPLLAVLEGLRDLWIQVPDTLRSGMTWTDSAMYTVCRDGVPLRSSTGRVFRVVGSEDRDGRPLVTVTRTSRSTVDGTGIQFGEVVSVTGSANAEMTYTLDPAAGAILSARGSSSLDLTLRTKLRTQVVHQAGSTSIAALPGASGSP